MVLGRYLAIKLMVIGTLVNINNGKSPNNFKVDPALKEFQILKPGKQTAPTSPQRASSELHVIQSFINLKFRNEIVRLYTFLPRDDRCGIFNDLVNATACNGIFITDLLLKNNIIHDSTLRECQALHRTFNCKGNNITHTIFKAFWNEMGNLFSKLPIPFQCTIVNKISTSQSASKKRRHRRSSVLTDGNTLRISLQMVENQLQKVYPSLNITQKCSKEWKPLKKKVPLESVASLVNITVKLDDGTRRKAWVKRLRRKGFRIYNIYRRFKSKESTESMKNPPKLSRRDVRLIVVRFTKKSRLVVNAVLSLEIKEPGSSHYSKVSSAKQIVKAINSIGAVTMRRLFYGTVLALTVAKKERGDSGSLWTTKDTAKARAQFPSFLRSYFRVGIDRLGRCLVMIYISTNLQRDLRPVEMFYNSINYLPKKYFCLLKDKKAERKTGTNVSVNIFYRTNETFQTKSEENNLEREENKIEKGKNLFLEKINERENVSLTFPDSEYPLVVEKDRELDGSSASARKVTALEIGLFALLALLCVAIVAFTINCIIFALRKRSTRSAGEEPPKSAFGLFHSMDVILAKEQREKCEKVEQCKNNTKLRNCYLSEPKSSTSAQETQEINSDTVNLQQSAYSKDPLRSIPSYSSELLKTFDSESSQKSREINSESDDEVFSEHTPPVVSSSDEYIALKNGASIEGVTKHERQRTLKESCGEMKLLSDSTVKSCSSSRDFDPYIKNNTIQVVVVIDDTKIST